MLSVSLAYTSLPVARLLRPCPSREKWRAIAHSALQVPTPDRTGVRVNAGEAAVGAPYSDRAAALGRAVLHEHFPRATTERRGDVCPRRRREQTQKRRRAARGSCGDWWAGGTASPKASAHGRPAQGSHSRPRFAPSSHPARATFPASRRTCRGSAERGRAVDDSRSRSTDPAGRPRESAWTPWRRLGGNSVCVSTMTARLRVQRACRGSWGQTPTSRLG